MQLGRTVPDDQLKMKPDTMMVGITTDELRDMESKVMEKSKTRKESLIKDMANRRSQLERLDALLI